jgi:hypothetical protein
MSTGVRGIIRTDRRLSVSSLSSFQPIAPLFFCFFLCGHCRKVGKEGGMCTDVGGCQRSIVRPCASRGGEERGEYGSHDYDVLF